MENFKNVCQLLLLTLASLFISYHVVMFSDQPEINEGSLWFFKVLIVAAFVFFNALGWFTALPNKEQSN